MEIFGARVVAYFALFAIVLDLAYATDPTQLQDFCVATNDTNNALFVNGLFCKDPMQVKAEDFLFRGLNVPGDTGRLGAKTTQVNAGNLPGLNTLGITLARIDFAPHGLNPPHIHPRSSEVLTVVQGTLYVGFVTSNLPNGGNKFFTKVLYEGDVFVFPQSLIHFQFNVGKTQALAYAGHSSQNPGETTIANAVFGAQPPISVDVLAKAFQLDDKTVKFLQSFFGTNN